MEGRFFEKFQKIKKFSKFQKFPKAFPKVSKGVLNVFWGKFLQKNFLPSVPWKLETSKLFKKIKKFSKFQKSRKSLPKVSKRVLNVFWGKFFQKKKFLPSVPWRLETSKFWKKSKNSQNSKYAQNRSQNCPNVFWTCFGAIFLKFF